MDEQVCLCCRDTTALADLLWVKKRTAKVWSLNLYINSNSWRQSLRKCIETRKLISSNKLVQFPDVSNFLECDY